MIRYKSWYSSPGIVSYSAPRIPNTRPTISIVVGIVLFIIAIMIVRRMLEVHMRAEHGPAGAPV